MNHLKNDKKDLPVYCSKCNGTIYQCKCKRALDESPAPVQQEGIEDIKKFKEYFEQQLSLQKDSKFKYTTEEAYVDAIEVCNNIIKNRFTPPASSTGSAEEINDLAIKHWEKHSSRNMDECCDDFIAGYNANTQRLQEVRREDNNPDPGVAELKYEIQLSISKIVDDIVIGNTHPYTAKIDLLKLLSAPPLIIYGFTGGRNKNKHTKA